MPDATPPTSSSVDDVDVLEFTPTRRDTPPPRAANIDATVCGHTLTWHEPKRAVLFVASQMVSDEVTDADRASALLQLINGSLDPGDQKQFMDAALDRDDPLGRDATFDLVHRLIEHWTTSDTADSPGSITVPGPESGPTFYGDKPVRITNTDLDLDFIAHPVKDLVLMFTSAGVSTTGSVGQQAWGLGTFLEACLDPGDAFQINTRLRDRRDALEIEDMVDIVTQLIDTWAPDLTPAPANREQRRAQSRSKPSTSSKGATRS